MKFNVNPKNRLVAATRILSGLGIELNVKSINAEITRSRVQDLEVLGATEAQALGEVISHLDSFNDIVNEQVKEMRTAERYEIIRKNFKTTLDDAERMINQVSDDGKMSLANKVQNRVMKWRRGSIQSRFKEIRNISEQVSADVADQIKREVIILDAYKEFRISLKESTVVSQVLLEKAEARKNEYAKLLQAAQKEVDEAKAAGTGLVQIGMLEIKRDEAQREFETEDRRYQTAIDFSEQLSIAYGMTEGVMARMSQTTELKEAQQSKSALFYTANSGALTALMTAFTSVKGLHEQTQTQKAMVDGTNEAIERLSKIGDKVHQRALEATYGATLNAQSLKSLFESAVAFEENQRSMIENLREKSKKNDAEIRKVIEEGQRRLAQAVANRHTKKGASVENTTDVQVAEPEGIEIEVPSLGAQALKTMRSEAETTTADASPRSGMRPS